MGLGSASLALPAPDSTKRCGGTSCQRNQPIAAPNSEDGRGWLPSGGLVSANGGECAPPPPKKNSLPLSRFVRI
jgi:hypothetical protein